MRSSPWVLTWILVLATPGMLYAHGMSHEITKKEAVVITAEFDDGEPASYAQVKVFSPESGEIEYQNGRTDKHGCFAFLPDRPGEWNITILAGMGHRIETAFVANEALENQKKQDTGGVFPRWQGVVTGLGLIFGASEFITYFRIRKLQRQVP